MMMWCTMVRVMGDWPSVQLSLTVKILDFGDLELSKSLARHIFFRCSDTYVLMHVARYQTHQFLIYETLPTYHVTPRSRSEAKLTSIYFLLDDVINYTK